MHIHEIIKILEKQLAKAWVCPLELKRVWYLNIQQTYYLKTIMVCTIKVEGRLKIRNSFRTEHTAQKWSFPLQFPVDLVTYTEEICNEKLHFLCSNIMCSPEALKLQIKYCLRLQEYQELFFWKIATKSHTWKSEGYSEPCKHLGWSFPQK